MSKENSIDNEKIIDRVAEKLAEEIKNTINIPTLRLLVLDSLKNIVAKKIADKIADDVVKDVKIELAGDIVVKLNKMVIDIDVDSLRNEVYEKLKARIVDEILDRIRIDV